MEQNIISDTLTAVNLFLKDGRRLCGLVLNNVNNTDQDSWKFVSNWNLPEFERTHSNQYVETFSTDMIHHIDPYLK
jgi:hypothetical protein